MNHSKKAKGSFAAPNDSSKKLSLMELKQKAISLQNLRRIASDQVLEAEIAYEDITCQCKEAWEEFHSARKQCRTNGE